MISQFHFLRPWGLLSLIPLIVLAYYLWQRKPPLQAWAAICDRQLLAHLIKHNNNSKRYYALACLLASAIFMIIALAGPTWIKLPIPAYRQLLPRVVVLDMSETMLEKDLNPDRLSRAKFALHDLFTKADLGQIALVVYTGEPFVVSPLTEDGKTIDSLLTILNRDIMPVDGQQLDTALTQAADLIKQAGYGRGQVLVLTASPPSEAALATAKTLAAEHIYTSVMPVVADSARLSLYQPLAEAGKGALLPFTNTDKPFYKWLNAPINSSRFSLSKQQDIPQWRDEGRWFLIPALLFLLPLFRRGWLQRVEV